MNSPLSDFLSSNLTPEVVLKLEDVFLDLSSTVDSPSLKLVWNYFQTRPEYLEVKASRLLN